MSASVLVVGGNGFIGSHLVEHLLDQGASVRVLDRNRVPTNIDAASVDYIASDLLDTRLIQKALDGVDRVYHLASTSTPATSVKDPIADIHGNLLGTVNLLNMMHKLGVNQITFVSSGGTVYGVPELLPIPESHPTNPISSYGITKLAIEKYIQMYHHNYGIQYCILRAANAYGPRQNLKNPQGAVTVMLRQAIRGEEFTVMGDGSVTRDFIYVTDLVDAITKSTQGTLNQIYNIGTQTAVSIIDLIKAGERLGITVPHRFESPRSYDVPAVVLDVSKARSELGWEPGINLEQGIALTYQYLVAQSESSGS